MNQKKIVAGILIVLILAVMLVLVWQKKEEQAVKQNHLPQVTEWPSTSVQTLSPVEKWNIEREKWVTQMSNADLVWYEIPELKIRFKTTKENVGDFAYKYESTTLGFESGADAFDGVYIHSKSLQSSTSCPEILGSIKRFRGDPGDYSRGALLGNVNQEVALGDMRFFDEYFIDGDFSYEIEVPNNCFAGTDYYSVWEEKSKELMYSFRTTVESTYEIPEYGMKIGIAPWQFHRISTYDSMRAELKKQGQSLVWYEIPELKIKFLVTPDTKNDLRYKLRAMPADDSGGASDVSFYYQSVADITDCDVNGEITCSNLSLSSVLIEKIGAYQSKNGRPFCGSMEESHSVGAHEFCVRYQNDFQLTAEQEKEYQKKHKDIFLGILPETLQSM